MFRLVQPKKTNLARPKLAYFTIFGKNKRIYIYSTIILTDKRYLISEQLAVSSEQLLCQALRLDG